MEPIAKIFVKIVAKLIFLPIRIDLLKAKICIRLSQFFLKLSDKFKDHADAILNQYET